MCCLTIVKSGEDIIISHNRDESIYRQLTSDPSVLADINGFTTIMPTDPVSKGTWIGSNGYMTAAILNGYKVKHVRQLPYQLSRGSIIPYLFDKGNIKDFLNDFTPSHLEPFTLVVFDQESIYELGWDAERLHVRSYATDTPLIYSSCTLYDKEVCRAREAVFKTLLREKPEQGIDKYILGFHQKFGLDHGAFINTEVTDIIKTVAITQVVHQPLTSTFYYQVIGQAPFEKQLV